MIKVILQSPRPKDHINTIGIDQSLSNNSIFEHRCLQNIKKLYKHAGKFDDQIRFKYIIEAAMVFTPEVFTNNNPKYPMNPPALKKKSARKSLCPLTNKLDVKKNCYPSSCSF